jgi:hypothetical protein
VVKSANPTCGAQIAQLTTDLHAEKQRRIAAEDKAEKAPSEGDNTPPLSPAFCKQIDALKKRIAQLEAELAAANARQPHAASTSHIPPPSTLGDWHGTDASAAEYYQYQYSSASDNVAVLALLVQEAVRAHYWPSGASRKVLHYGQPHGPMVGRVYTLNAVYP